MKKELSKIKKDRPDTATQREEQLKRIATFVKQKYQNQKSAHLGELQSAFVEIGVSSESVSTSSESHFQMYHHASTKFWYQISERKMTKDGDYNPEAFDYSQFFKPAPKWTPGRTDSIEKNQYQMRNLYDNKMIIYGKRSVHSWLVNMGNTEEVHILWEQVFVFGLDSADFERIATNSNEKLNIREKMEDHNDMEKLKHVFSRSVNGTDEIVDWMDEKEQFTKLFL